jgi:hypothetical protein
MLLSTFEIADYVNIIRKESLVSPITPLIINKVTAWLTLAASAYLSDFEKSFRIQNQPGVTLLIWLLAFSGYVKIYAVNKILFYLVSILILVAPFIPIATKPILIICAGSGLFMLKAQIRKSP